MTKFRIIPKRDFGSGNGFWIDRQWVKSGFVVTDGICNVMPGATWFQTIPEAMRAIRILVEADGNAKLFWQRIRE